MYISNILCLYGGGDGVCRINHLFLKAFISFDNNYDKQITQLGPLLVTIFTAQVIDSRAKLNFFFHLQLGRGLKISTVQYDNRLWKEEIALPAMQQFYVA
ncbi:hypothetical protein T07_13459 [Trichinella nelsoni]|uniref:Uncharacterized protein n=1 Tax=Trichinella nelsoni TaxID=6336 RepID=A0A0V0RRR8_9BILA|nr:hypothetical protein T07_13459 [Trichinella nelsoni]